MAHESSDLYWVCYRNPRRSARRTRRSAAVGQQDRASAQATSPPPAPSFDSAEHAELALYPGTRHFFADSSQPSYDARATAVLTRCVLDFLRAS
jgi:hypothetical protein